MMSVIKCGGIMDRASVYETDAGYMILKNRPYTFNVEIVDSEYSELIKNSIDIAFKTWSSKVAVNHNFVSKCSEDCLFITIGSDKQGVLARAFHSSIHMNEYYLSRLNDICLTNVITHEIGHVIDYSLGDSNNTTHNDSGLMAEYYIMSDCRNKYFTISEDDVTTVLNTD